MLLQEKLISLSKYNIGFKTHNDKFLVSINYKEGWSAIQPSDSEIEFLKDKEKPDTYYYIAPLDTEAIHLQNIFNVIDETITYNEELEKKLELFQKKVEEMQVLFSEKPLDELLTMEFVCKNNKKTKNKKKNTKVTDETVIDNIAETSSEEVSDNKETINDIDKRVSEVIRKKQKNK